MNKTKLSTHHSNVETITSKVLFKENQQFQGSGGVSRENSAHGFKPAFCDTRTGNLYLSRFASGELAPIHLLDGLPEQLVAGRSDSGQVRSTVDSLVAGFVLEGHFFTRDEAAMAVKNVQYSCQK